MYVCMDYKLYEFQKAISVVRKLYNKFPIPKNIDCQSAVTSKTLGPVSFSLEITPPSTSHNSISETFVHILSGQTEFDSRSNSVWPLKMWSSVPEMELW